MHLPSERVISTFYPHILGAGKVVMLLTQVKESSKAYLVEEEICLGFEQVEFEIEWKSHVEIFGKQLVGHVGLKLGSNQEIEEDIWESLSDVPWRKLRGGVPG